MENEDLVEKNGVNSPNAKKMEVGTDDLQREKEKELPSGVETLNIAEGTPSLQHAKEGEEMHGETRALESLNITEEVPNLSHDKEGERSQIVETRELESLNAEQNLKLHHEKEGEGSHDQSVETRELESLNAEQNPKLHHEKEGEGSHDQSVDTRELESVNAEQNPKLHHAKEGEGSHDQSVETRELGSLNAEQNPKLQHEKEGEGSHDQSVDTRELESLNAEQNLKLHHEKEGEGSHDQSVETRELESLNAEQNPKLHHEKEGEGSHDQSVDTRELESLNAEQNPKLHHEKEGEGSHDQSVETRERESLNAEQHPKLHHEKEGEGSHDQSVVTRELGSLNAEQNPNLHHEKEGEGSQSVETRELVSLNAEQNADIQHDKGREASHDHPVETRELESLNAEQNAKVQHDKGGEGSHDQTVETRELESLNAEQNAKVQHAKGGEGSHDQSIEIIKDELENQEDPSQSTEKTLEEEQEPVFDGTEIPEGNAWPEKAAAIKNFVKERSVVAVSSMLRRLSGRKNEYGQSLLPDGEEKNDIISSNLKDDSTSSNLKDADDSTAESKPKEDAPKTVERSLWNPLSYIKSSKDADTPNKEDQVDDVGTEELPPPPTLKGRIILYTRLGCQDCKEVRLILHRKMLRYVEINIDVYPGRKSELEKYTGSSSVPKVFFNEIPVGGLSELKAMEDSGHFDEKVKELIAEEPSSEAPIPPLSGEDDLSCSGPVDELAVIVGKMKETILVKDRFYKMRRITNCFLASEAIDFLSQNQDLERQEAIELARKLVSKKFFKHVLDENAFEDGNQLYRFLDHDPIVSSQCHNISRGITDVKPKSLTEIASRLRFLSFAIFEAYTSEDGKHIDYRSIHGSEEFARYLRVVEELQRVDLEDLSREEKLAFFINLFNMMAIHAILLWGYPAGALERRKTLGDFKYVVGGCTYSLSAIQNGILRGNQRPPYNITKPFGAKDSRSKIALSYAEPLIHFALVCGNKSGPALRCYSPGDIDKELMEAARDFLRNGGIIVDPETKVASVSKILKWYSVDFGKNEHEVLKHATNYLEPEKSAELLELLASNQLKVTYQAYDWGVNC